MTSTVTNGGKGIQTGRMIGATPSQAELKYMGWGTGAGAGSAASTDVSGPAGEARALCTLTQQTVSVTNDTFQMAGTLTNTVGGVAKTITNVGFFDAAGSGSPPSGGTLGVIFDGMSLLLNPNEGINGVGKIQY